MKLRAVLMFVQEAEMKEYLTKSRLRLLEVEQAVKLVDLLAKFTQSTKSLFHLDFRDNSRYKPQHVYWLLFKCVLMNELTFMQLKWPHNVMTGSVSKLHDAMFSL